MRAPTVRKRLNSGILTGLPCSSVLSTAETKTSISVRGIVVIAPGATQIVCIIVPRPAAQHPLYRARTDATYVVAPSGAFPSIRSVAPEGATTKRFFKKIFDPAFGGIKG
jgi:hypothetical protein